MSSQQRAEDLLEKLNSLIDRVNRTQVTLVVLAVVTLVSGGFLLVFRPVQILEAFFGAPVAAELVVLVGLVILGVFLFLAKGIVERVDRLNFKRETIKVVEEILDEDPQIEKSFNRSVISTIYEEILAE